MTLIDPHAAMDKLAALGSSQAIAEFLQVEGVTGMRDYGHACPVSWYLRRATGWRATVSPTAWSLRARDLPAGMRRRSRTPQPIREFIVDFDGGRYPELAWSVPGDGAASS